MLSVEFFLRLKDKKLDSVGDSLPYELRRRRSCGLLTVPSVEIFSNKYRKRPLKHKNFVFSFSNPQANGRQSEDWITLSAKQILRFILKELRLNTGRN